LEETDILMVCPGGILREWLQKKDTTGAMKIALESADLIPVRVLKFL
jgi:hypothetical protein